MLHYILGLPEAFQADLAARGFAKKPPLARFRKPLVHFTYLLRQAERFSGGSHRMRYLAALYRFRARSYGARYGITLPVGVAGPGLFLVHYGSVIISGDAKIGSNCRVHSGVNVGSGTAGAPVIGDDVYLGPGAKLFGGIAVGNGVKIGANAVVNFSVPDGATVVSPLARILEPKSERVTAET